MSLVKEYRSSKAFPFKEFPVIVKLLEKAKLDGTKITTRKISKMLKESKEYSSLTKSEKQKYYNSLIFISLGTFKV